MGLKGAAGSKPCIVCRNVVQFVDADSMAGSRYVGIDVVNRTLLEYQSNNDIYQIADRLQHTSTHRTRTQLEHEEKAFGISYIPGGLLFDNHIRGLLHPVDHYIRDPQHVLLSGGVAGTHMARLLATLGTEIRRQLQAYVACFQMPKAAGKNPSSLLDDKRVEDDHMRCFAGELLDLAPLVMAFLEDALVPKNLFPDHTHCFSLLVRILQICTSGPRRAASNVDELQRTIDNHHEMYKRLYPEWIKPKWHQMLHIPEDVKDLGLMLSCFVTERKHRSIKRAAVWTFRHYDHTLISDIVYRELENLRSEAAIFHKQYLISPVATHGMETSTRASFVFGDAHRGDLIACRGRVIIEVDRMWQQSQSIVVQGRPLIATDKATHWRRAMSGVAFVPAADLVGVLKWAQQGDRLRVILPPHGLGFD